MIAGFFEHSIYTGLWITLLISYTLVSVFWCVSLQKALELADPQLRKMKPVNVWLSMIPVFGFAWQFIAVMAVAKTLRDEFTRRGVLTREPLPGQNSGITASILFCFVIAPSFGLLLAVISNIPRLIHRAKIEAYMRQLQEVIEIQSQPAAYAAPDLSVYSQPPVSPEEELQKDNPDRFKPPVNPETDYERWKKKD